MSMKYEELEGNLVKLTIEVPVAEVKKAEDTVYKKMRGRINVPGFRKGKAPRLVIENTYGKGVFLEDAVNEILPQAYEDAVKEAEETQGIKVASYPELDYTQVEVDKDLIFTATVAKRPEVTLGEYKGLKVETESEEVTDEDIAKALEAEQQKNAVEVPVEGRAVQDGDMISLDFLGKKDDVPFDGGEGKDYPLLIGSGSFIPGFEEQLVGMNIGETKDINVTFPEEYHEKSLAGAPVVFTCTVNSIKAKELPELNDEFASEVSEFETLEEYKNDLKEKLIDSKKKEAKAKKEDALLEMAVANASMDVPELMIKSEARQAVSEFGQRLQMQGLSLEQYMQYTGQSEEDMIKAQMEQSEKTIKSRLVLEAIAKAEAIEVSDEDLEKELEKMAEQYKVEVEKVRSWMSDDQLEQLKGDLATGKAVDLLYDTAK